MFKSFQIMNFDRKAILILSAMITVLVVFGLGKEVEAASPDAPSSLGPSNYIDGSWGNDNNPTLQFTQTDSDATDTVKFTIQIDDTSNYSSPVVDYTSGLMATGTTSFTVGQATSVDSGIYVVGQEGQTLSDSSYYWRVMSTDNTSATSTWTTATSTVAFKVDTSAPISVSITSIGADSISQLTAVATATDAGSGLHATPFWFTETSNNPGSSSSTVWQASANFVDAGLATNTQYIYKVKAKDTLGNESSYSATSYKYTLAPAPTNLAGTLSQTTMTLTVDSFTNSTADSSGYYFWRTGNNSGWVQNNSWQDTGLNCGTPYTFYVKYRNGDGTETNSISLTASTLPCAAPGGWFMPPKAIEKPITEMTVEELKAKIDEVLAKIAQLEEQLQQLVEKEVLEIPADYRFDLDLKYGQRGDDVRYLQIFLKTQGPEIYPEGIVSGWFGPLTEKAIISFQEKYTEDILSPWELTSGTGFVGETTRAKINELLGR